MPAVGVLTGSGEVSSGGGVGARGGRVVVEDEHGVSGHHSPERGRHRVPWVLDWRKGCGIGGGLALES